MNRSDWRDYAVYALVVALGVFGSVYLWKHPSEVSFATWATVCGGIVAAMRWFDLRDDKEADHR
jgi:hypothetical protein